MDAKDATEDLVVIISVPFAYTHRSEALKLYAFYYSTRFSGDGCGAGGIGGLGESFYHSLTSSMAGAP